MKEPPEPPTNIQLESSSSRSLFIKWQTPLHTGNSPIIQYNILIFELGKTMQEVANFDYKVNMIDQQQQSTTIASNQDSNKFLKMLNHLISTTSNDKNMKSASLDPSLTSTHNHFNSLDTIDYQNNNVNNKMINFTVLANSNSYVIRGLNPATNYSIQMQSVNIIGKSDLSLPIYATTEEEAPSSTVKNVQINVLNATSIIVTWNPPDANHLNGILKGFYIGTKQKNSTSHFTYKTLQIDKHQQQQSLDEQQTLPNPLSSIINKNQYQLVLNRLKPYTEYVLVVQAYNQIGAGPRSDEVKFKTDQSTPIAAPTITKCTSPNSRTLHLAWTKLSTDKLNGELAGYKIHYYTFDEQQQTTKQATEENQLVVDGNQNLATNVFQTASDTNEIQNQKYDQLINLSLINPIRRTEHIPNDQNETQISNLNKFTNYTISIQAFTSAGDGPLSKFFNLEMSIFKLILYVFCNQQVNLFSVQHPKTFQIRRLQLKLCKQVPIPSILPG